MDAEILKVILERYDKKLSDIQRELDVMKDDMATNVVKAVCVSHGGHEMVEKGAYNCKYKQCKHCGLPEDSL